MKVRRILMSMTVLFISFTIFACNNKSNSSGFGGINWFMGGNESVIWTHLTQIFSLDRYGHTAIYDNNGNMIIFGGYDDKTFQYLNDVWSYNLSTHEWTQLSSESGPSSRMGHSAIYNGSGNMIVFGGYDGSYKNDVWSYKISTQTWTKLTSSSGPAGRWCHSAIYDGSGKMIIFGGGNGNALNDLWNFDNSTGMWTQITTSWTPSARYGHSAIYDGLGYMWVFGGCDGSSYNNEVWRYDISMQEWGQFSSVYSPDPKPSARACHSVISVNSGNTVNMIIFGGTDGSSSYNDMWRWSYNTLTMSYTWSKLDWVDEQSNRFLNSAIYDDNGNMFIFGGYDGNKGRSDIWSYNIWWVSSPQLALSPRPSTRYVQSAIYDGSGNMIVFGGADGSGGCYKDVWRYNISARSWTQLASSSGPGYRYGHSAIYDDSGNMIIFGGAYFFYYNAVWSYNISTQTWTKLASSSGPSYRIGHSAINDGSGNMIVFGGYDGSYKNDVWSYKISTQTWTKLTSSSGPAGRWCHSAIYDGSGKMIVFGGGGSNDTYYNDIWSYNLATQTWAQIASSSDPEVRFCHSAIYDGLGNMIIFGGYNNDSHYLSDIWSYNIATQTWTQPDWLSGMPIRAGQSAIYDGLGKMIIFGGTNNSGNDLYNDVWCFNIKKQNSPIQLASASEFTNNVSDRVGHSAIYDGSRKMIIFGGNDGSCKNDVWSYNTLTNAWMQLASSSGPSARQLQSAIYDDSGNMIVFGGADSSTKNDVWSYNISTQTWTQLASSSGPAARYFHSAIYDGSGNMIIFGGLTSYKIYGSTKNDVWSYNISTQTWTQLASLSGPSTRFGHSAIYDGSENMIIFGGAHTGHNYSDIWSYNISTQTWTQLTLESDTGYRQGHSAVYDGLGNMIIFGGYGIKSGNVGYFNDAWSYNIFTKTWTQLASSSGPSARAFHSAIYNGSWRMFIFGGTYSLSDYDNINLWSCELP